MPVLYLVPIYFASRGELVRPLAGRLERSFKYTVEIRSPSFDAERAFERSRGQYNSTLLLASLLAESPAKGDRVVGLTTVDLFISVLTYVFGEAQLEGTAAVVSTHRLDPETYGLPRDDRRLFQRLLTETVHELGHTFGLVHCDVAGCVMTNSTYVEQIDLKTERFCPACASDLRIAGKTARRWFFRRPSR